VQFRLLELHLFTNCMKMRITGLKRGVILQPIYIYRGKCTGNTQSSTLHRYCSDPNQLHHTVLLHWHGHGHTAIISSIQTTCVRAWLRISTTYSCCYDDADFYGNFDSQ